MFINPTFLIPLPLQKKRGIVFLRGEDLQFTPNTGKLVSKL